MAVFVFATYPISLAIQMSPAMTQYWTIHDYATTSSTTVSLWQPSNRPGEYYARLKLDGTGFAAALLDDRIAGMSAGTIAAITFGGPNHTDPIWITGLNLSAESFYDDLISGDRQAAYLSLLSGHDSICGGLRDDSLEGLAGKDTVRGLSGDDRLSGGFGDDDLLGGTGADRLSGGAGSDRLTGGHGRDAFVFETGLGRSQRDTITDFRAADDVIRLDDAIFAAFGASGTVLKNQFVQGSIAADTEDRIIYDRAAGVLSYDRDGLGGAGQVVFALVEPDTALNHRDFVII